MKWKWFAARGILVCSVRRQSPSTHFLTIVVVVYCPPKPKKKKFIDNISGQSERNQVRRTLRVYIYAFLSLFCRLYIFFFGWNINKRMFTLKKKKKERDLTNKTAYILMRRDVFYLLFFNEREIYIFFWDLEV